MYVQLEGVLTLPPYVWAAMLVAIGVLMAINPLALAWAFTVGRDGDNGG